MGGANIIPDGYVKLNTSFLQVNLSPITHPYRAFKDGSPFESNGKIGWRKDELEVCPPVFDKIEFMQDRKWLYFQNEDNYAFYSEDGHSSFFDEFDNHGCFFVENGLMGWKENGKVVIPAYFNKVTKWSGMDIYETESDRVRYFNSNMEEILTSVRDLGDIEESAPFSTSFDEGDVFTVKVFPPRKKTPLSNVVETSDGRRMGITRISRKELNDELLNSCDEISLKPRDLYNLNNEVTGEFRTFRFYLDNIAPAFLADSLISMLEEFKATNANNILRITTSPGERILPDELRKLRHYFENQGPSCFKIALGEDDTLAPCTVSVLITSFFTEDFSYYEWGKACENGCIEDVKEAEMLMKYRIHEEENESQWDIEYDYNINDAFTNVRYNMNRSWRKTEEVLNYLVELGAKINSFNLTYPFYSSKGESEMNFNIELLKWGIRKGIDINQVSSSRTCIDWLEKAMDKAPLEAKPYINEAIDLLRLNGGLTCEEIRSIECSIHPSYDEEIGKIRRINDLA